MTLDELYAFIKRESHDYSFSPTMLYNYINKAIEYMEDHAEFNYQKVVRETQTLSANSDTLSTIYTIKRVVKIEDDNDNEISKDLYYIDSSDHIRFFDTSSDDKDYQITYIRRSPVFDGTSNNFIVPEKLHLTLGVGAVAYAMMYNNQPEMQAKFQEFNMMINDNSISDYFMKQFDYKSTNVKGI